MNEAVTFIFWVAHSLSSPVDSSLYCQGISLLALRLASSCIYFFGVAGMQLVSYRWDLGGWLFLLNGVTTSRGDGGNR